MFEYNFNFVKTFLIWCFQDFTKGKFIQMNFIYLKLEFFNKWKWYPAWFLIFNKILSSQMDLDLYFLLQKFPSLQRYPKLFLHVLTNFYILYFLQT